jgi:hypothetical protein
VILNTLGGVDADFDTGPFDVAEIIGGDKETPEFFSERFPALRSCAMELEGDFLQVVELGEFFETEPLHWRTCWKNPDLERSVLEQYREELCAYQSARSKKSDEACVQCTFAGERT